MDKAAKYFDRICDELIDPEDLAQSERPSSPLWADAAFATGTFSCNATD